jgi:hypothetical protein
MLQLVQASKTGRSMGRISVGDVSGFAHITRRSAKLEKFSGNRNSRPKPADKLKLVLHKKPNS